MKKLFALMLALMLLAGLAAQAETNATVVRLSNLSLAAVNGGSARSVKFNKAALQFAVGVPNGITTLQSNFDNGNGQVVDAVLQVVDREIRFSMGGLTGVFIIDLNAFATEGNSGDAIARGLNEALTLAGTHLDMVLYAITQDDGKGMRSVEVPLPATQLIVAAEGLLSVAEGMDAAEDIDLDGLHDSVQSIGDGAVLSFRYNPSSGAFELSAVQNGRGMRMSGTMTIGVEPMTFFEVSDAEERYDVLNLSPETLAQIQGEMNMILKKLVNYAGGTGLDKLIP